MPSVPTNTTLERVRVQSPRVCTVTTLKADLAQTLAFVNYHLNIGIDWMILFFDNPTDPAIDSLRGNNRVACIPCDDEYWRAHDESATHSIESKQIANAMRALEMAREREFQWIVHIDCDELLYSNDGIQAILSDTDAEIVTFDIREAVPEREHYGRPFADIRLFRKPSTEIRQSLARKLGCRNAFYRGEYFRGHLVSKSAVRVNSSITRMGIHLPEAGANAVKAMLTKKIVLLHFDSHDFDRWRLKWEQRSSGQTKVVRIRSNRQHQLEVFTRARQQGDAALRRLYRQLCCIPAREILILRLLGMLETVRLDPRLFNPFKEYSA
jgi:hypothetical protein